MLNVYFREAHPTDEWCLDLNDRLNICLAQTKTLEARLEAAALLPPTAAALPPVRDEQCLRWLRIRTELGADFEG